MQRPSLKRSSTMPARVNTPSTRVAASRRTHSKKAAANRRRAATTTRATTKSSVKKQVLALAETKTFHAEPSNYATLYLSPTQAFAATGFGTTSNKSTWVPGGTNLNYGNGALADMKMLRPFKNTSATTWEESNALDGLTCTPMVGKVTLNFARLPFHAVTEEDHITACPMRIRVIRVSSKGSSATIEECNPTNDIFRNQYNQEEGPATAGVLSAELGTLRVNRDKYVVHDDIQFTLNRPVSWDNSTARGRGVFPGNTTSPTSKIITFYPQLTEKKDGSVRYTSPNDAGTTNATSGHRREFILVHCWYPGITSRDSVAADLINDVKIYVTPESRHKDI